LEKKGKKSTGNKERGEKKKEKWRGKDKKIFFDNVCTRQSIA
jgi:hypothetical protein